MGCGPTIRRSAGGQTLTRADVGAAGVVPGHHRRRVPRVWVADRRFGGLLGGTTSKGRRRRRPGRSRPSPPAGTTRVGCGPTVQRSVGGTTTGGRPRRRRGRSRRSPPATAHVWVADQRFGGRWGANSAGQASPPRARSGRSPPARATRVGCAPTVRWPAGGQPLWASDAAVAVVPGARRRRGFHLWVADRRFGGLWGIEQAPPQGHSERSPVALPRLWVADRRFGGLLVIRRR